MEKSVFLGKIAEMAKLAELPTPQGYREAKLFLKTVYRNRLGGYDNYKTAPYLDSFLEGIYEDESACKEAEQREFTLNEEYREVSLSSKKIEWFCSKNKITHAGYTGRDYRGSWVSGKDTHTYSFAGAIPAKIDLYIRFDEDFDYYIVSEARFKNRLLEDGYCSLDDVASKGYIVKTKAELIETGWGFEHLPDNAWFLWKPEEYKSQIT